MMKRLVILMVIGSILCASAVDAGARSKRWKLEESYKAPGIGAFSGSTHTGLYVYDCVNGIGCAKFVLPGPTARVKVEIFDNSGRPVLGHVLVDGVDAAQICGASEEPVLVAGGTTMRVQVAAGDCADGTPSIPTGGTIRVTKV